MAQYKLVTCTINGKKREQMVDVRASLTDMIRNNTCLFLQFTYTGIQGILPLFQFSCRQFQYHLIVRTAILADKIQLALLVQSRNANAAVVLHDFPFGFTAVRQPHPVAPQIQNSAAIQIDGFQSFFPQFHLSASLSTCT